MKFYFKLLSVLLLLVFVFASCSKDDAISITLSVQDMALKAGQSDTLIATISCTGDASLVSVSVKVSDPKVAVATLITDQKKNLTKGSTFTRLIVVKAVAGGSTSVVLHAGSKNVSCHLVATQTELTLTQSVILNYGLAFEASDNKVLALYLFPETFSIDNASETFEGQGKIIRIETFIPPFKSTLTAGEYTQNKYGAENSFLPGATYSKDGQTYLYGTYIMDYSNKKSTYTLIKSGTYTVSTVGDVYTIKGELTTETNEIVRFTYSGLVSLLDRTEKPTVKTPQFTKGALYFGGDYYHRELSNAFFAYLQTHDVNLNDTVINGEVLLVQFNVSQNYSTRVPDGNYRMLSQSQFADYLVAPYTLVPGYEMMYPTKTAIDGCWYYDHNSGKRLTAGSVLLSSQISGTVVNYILDYSLYDRIGTLVKGTCNFSAKGAAYAPKYPASQSKQTVNSNCQLAIPESLPQLLVSPLGINEKRLQ